MLEPAHIIALPAMKGNGGLGKSVDSLFGIDSKLSVKGFNLIVNSP